MAKSSVFLLLLLLAIAAAQVSFKAGFCPQRNSVSQCTPRCVNDHQCSSDSKCCPNKCGSTSCASPSAVSTGSDGGYKGSRDAVYCAGVKCSPYEKCELDRITKREKCVRK